MPPDAKTLSKIEKLLRLAAPSSGTSDAERTSAALEAARLFGQHDLVILPREIKRRVARSKTSSYHTRTTPMAYRPRQYAPPPGWVRSFAEHNDACVDPECGFPIFTGDAVWMRVRNLQIEYLHSDNGPCGW